MIQFGDIVLTKQNRKNQSYCYQTVDRFDYHGIEKALRGKTGGYYGEKFTPKRILVIQMK